MKKIFALWVAILLLSCSRVESDKSGSNTATTQFRTSSEKFKDIDGRLIIDYYPNGVSVITVDKCEYIVIRSSNGVAIIHKANCKNIEHKYDE